MKALRRRVRILEQARPDQLASPLTNEVLHAMTDAELDEVKTLFTVHRCGELDELPLSAQARIDEIVNTVLARTAEQCSASESSVGEAWTAGRLNKR